MYDFYEHWTACFIVLSLNAELNLECDFSRKRRNHSAEMTSKQQLSNLIIVQQDATYSVYYISVGSSTCFRC